MKIYFLLLALSFSFLATQAKQLGIIRLEEAPSLRRNTITRKSQRFKLRAGESYFSRYDSHNGIRNADADLELDLKGLKIELKGYTQERFDPHHYETLINPIN